MRDVDHQLVTLQLALASQLRYTTLPLQRCQPDAAHPPPRSALPQEPHGLGEAELRGRSKTGLLDGCEAVATPVVGDEVPGERGDAADSPPSFLGGGRSEWDGVQEDGGHSLLVKMPKRSLVEVHQAGDGSEGTLGRGSDGGPVLLEVEAVVEDNSKVAHGSDGLDGAAREEELGLRGGAGAEGYLEYLTLLRIELEAEGAEEVFHSEDVLLKLCLVSGCGSGTQQKEVVGVADDLGASVQKEMENVVDG